MTLTIPQIGARLAEAGRLTSRPLCIAGSDAIPKGAVPAPSIDRCLAKAILSVAVNPDTPPIYLGHDALEGCCPQGSPTRGSASRAGIRGSSSPRDRPDVAGGMALNLKARPRDRGCEPARRG